MPLEPAPGRSAGATVRKTGTDQTVIVASPPTKLPKYISPGRGADLSAGAGLGTLTFDATGVCVASRKS